MPVNYCSDNCECGRHKVKPYSRGGSKACPPDCVCGRHKYNNHGKKCLPDCNCARHYSTPIGEKHYRWASPPTEYARRWVYTDFYTTVHARISRYRGKASEYECVDCSKQAIDWSWIHDTDHVNIYNYEPRCRKCHGRYDAK